MSHVDQCSGRPLVDRLSTATFQGVSSGRALARPKLNGLATGTQLDEILGPASIPSGRLTEIFGGPSSGKTSVAFALLAACTSAGLLGAYVDPGGGFFAPAAAGAGIVLQRLLVVRPSSAEAARRAVDALVRCGACSVVVFDCTGLGDVLRTHHCARLASQADKTGTVLLVLSNGTIPAVASFASLRLRANGLMPLWQEGSDGGGRLAGCVAEVAVVKSKMAAPGKSASLTLLLPDVAHAWPAADGDRMEQSALADREGQSPELERSASADRRAAYA